MKSKLLIVSLLFASAGAVRADFNPVPLTPGSFNYAVVIPAGTAKLPPVSISATSGGGTGEGKVELASGDRGHENKIPIGE